MAESYWDLCDLKNISTVLQATLSYFNWHINLFFDHYFNFLSVKTEINKKKQTQINKSRGVRIFWKTKIWHIVSKVAELFWERCHLNNISRVLEITFSYFSILGGLCRISVISEFSFLGIGLKTKTRKSRKIFMFRSAKFKYSGPVFRSLF